MTPPNENPAEKLAAKLLALTDPSRLYRRRRPQEGEIQYAGPNDRAFASALDIGLCLLVLYKPFYYLTLLLFGEEKTLMLHSFGASHLSQEQKLEIFRSAAYWSTYLTNSGVQILILGAVFVGFWSYSGATPGKWLLRMRIVDEQTGKRPTQRQSIIRFLGGIVASLPLMLGFLWIIFDKKRQGWHDKMAGTVVIKVKHWRITPAEISEYPASSADEAHETEESEEEHLV